jgi:hypothetical protein
LIVRHKLTARSHSLARDAKDAKKNRLCALCAFAVNIHFGGPSLDGRDKGRVKKREESFMAKGFVALQHGPRWPSSCRKTRPALRCEINLQAKEI